MTQTGDIPAGAAEPPAITTLGELKDRLDPFETILCLGNGPSSEDPRLAAWRGATLFRVNWIWAERDWFTAPDVVFTGDADIAGVAKQPIIVFPTTVLGTDILRAYAAGGHQPSAGVAFLDRFMPPLADLGQARIPTNGALMVAMAAALQPDRLVIAGIDLYRHPLGKYPGPADNLDGYTSQHSAATDLELIGRTLSAYRGEAIILSDNLRDALERW